MPDAIGKQHPYPSNHQPGTHWATDEAWALLDMLPVGMLPDACRFYLGGCIAGTLMRVADNGAPTRSKHSGEIPRTAASIDEARIRAAAAAIADARSARADALKAHVETCPEHPMAKLKAELETLRPRVFPETLTPEVEDILCMMLWDSTPVAYALREGGAEIPRKVEQEQAAAMHFMLLLALRHGPDWRKHGAIRLNEIREAAERRAAEVKSAAGTAT